MVERKVDIPCRHTELPLRFTQAVTTLAKLAVHLLPDSFDVGAPYSTKVPACWAALGSFGFLAA
jgi:hypothetical protein